MTQGASIVHAFVTQWTTKPGHLNTLASAYKAQLLPQLEVAPGCRHAFVVAAERSNTLFTVSLWDSERERDANPGSPHHSKEAKLGRHLTNNPNQEPFEVLVRAGISSNGLFARLITLPVQADNIDAALTVYKEEYLPLLQAQPGFLQVIWLANRDSGTGWGMSFWSAREQMLAADQEGEFFPKVLARLAVYFHDKPEMHYYNVI
ncbi:MAG TPA: hypothetical protein DGR97_01455 [Gammaproteobacteria bacterium]|nr:hypothetical protein [Gammaproteobacteria bacterium]